MKTLSNFNQRMKIITRRNGPVQSGWFTINKSLMMIKWSNMIWGTDVGKITKPNFFVDDSEKANIEVFIHQHNNKENKSNGTMNICVANSHLQAFRRTTLPHIPIAWFWMDRYWNQKIIALSRPSLIDFAPLLLFYYQLLYASSESTNDE